MMNKARIVHILRVTQGNSRRRKDAREKREVGQGGSLHGTRRLEHSREEMNHGKKEDLP